MVNQNVTWMNSSRNRHSHVISFSSTLNKRTSRMMLTTVTLNRLVKTTLKEKWITHKPPSKKIPATATFNLAGICNCQTLPTGRHKIATSAIMLRKDSQIYAALLSSHLAGGSRVTSHIPLKGLQLRQETTSATRNQASTKAPMMCVKITNFFPTKISR